MSKGEKINTVERLIIDASRVSRYLGYPRKVPIWRINFILPKNCYIFRTEDNSDIALETTIHAKQMLKMDMAAFVMSSATRINDVLTPLTTQHHRSAVMDGGAFL